MSVVGLIVGPVCGFLDKNVQNRFSTWLLGQPSWISNQNDFSYIYSDLQVTLILPINFPVNRPICSKEVQNRFSRWPSWISDQNRFSYFWSTSHPDTSYQVSSKLAFRFRRRSAIYKFELVNLYRDCSNYSSGVKTCSLPVVTCYLTWAIVIGHQPFSLFILPSNHNFFIVWILTKLGWNDPCMGFSASCSKTA